MNRRQIEEGVTEAFSQKVYSEGLILRDKKFTGDHYAEYEFRIGELKYRFTIIFIKPNYIKACFYLSVYSEPITELYNKFSLDNKLDEFPLVVINLNSLMVPENKAGIYNSPDEVDIYINEQPVDSKEALERIADEFYSKVFLFVKNEVVPRTDSLNKIDYLFNTLPYENNSAYKPEWTTFAPFLPSQLLRGSLMAIFTDRADKSQLFDKYLSYASKFAAGQKEEIDIMRHAIQASR